MMEKKDRLHLANFPGIEEAFGISFNENELVACSIDKKAIDVTSRIINHHEAVSKVVEMYVGRVRKHNENEERAVDVWVLVVPEIIFERCRPDAKRAGLPMEKGDFGKKQKQRSDLPLLGDLVDHASEDIFDDAPDFHRKIKAEFLAIAPSQVLRETTLAPHSFKNKGGHPIRRTQDRAQRMPEIKTLLNDIMGLTKINYNSCNFNDGLPVTVRFANMVGEVLTMGSAKGTERQPFKYYV
jgi:hypothetical protein